MIENVKQRNEIVAFLDNLPDITYHVILPRENTIFYFQDPEVVMQLVDQFTHLIKCVTGPVNAQHEIKIKHPDSNVIIRKTLFFRKFQFRIIFNKSDDLINNCLSQINDLLTDMPDGNYQTRKWYVLRLDNSLTGTLVTPWSLWQSRTMPYVSQATLYLSNPQDFVYIKLLAAEYIHSTQEIMLFDDLIKE